MPPTEAPTPTTEAMPGEMAAPTTDTTAGGQVMVQMPSGAFDSIYTLVTQLASGLESLKAEVEAQKTGSTGAGKMTGAVPSEESLAGDEEFLKSIAEQGSMR